METASFGSRGCILQGKVALCPATPCIDSMGTVTHVDGGIEKFFFLLFFFFSFRPAIERKNYDVAIMRLFEKEKERKYEKEGGVELKKNRRGRGGKREEKENSKKSWNERTASEVSSNFVQLNS